MKTDTKQTYESVEELLSGCDRSELKSCVSSVLRNDRYIKWDLVSCSVNGDECRAVFSAPVKGCDLVYCLSYAINARGERGYISICVPASVETNLKL